MMPNTWLTMNVLIVVKTVYLVMPIHVISVMMDMVPTLLITDVLPVLVILLVWLLVPPLSMLPLPVTLDMV
jgi:hypothetical protein